MASKMFFRTENILYVSSTWFIAIKSFAALFGLNLYKSDVNSAFFHNVDPKSDDILRLPLARSSH